MTINKLLLAAACGAALACVALPAEAARSTTSLNVRSGPSTGYGVVDVLRPGEQVRVTRKSGGWCYLDKSGQNGWASCSYLTDIGSVSPRYGRNDDDPNVNFSVNTPNFSFSIGNGNGRPDVRPPRSRNAAVCFYEDWNYRGQSFCVRPGQQDRSLGTFNDRISSIRVVGNAEVRVCENFGFGGRCATIDNSMPRLNGRNNDVISSYRVR